MNPFIIFSMILSFEFSASAASNSLTQTHDNSTITEIQVFGSQPHQGQFLKSTPESEWSEWMKIVSTERAQPYQVIELSKAPTCQTMSGFGFALTESTAINIYKLKMGQRMQVMQKLFDANLGAGFNYVIVPISSTDFNDTALGDFSVCDCEHPTPSGYCFNATRLGNTVQILQQAQKMNPHLQLMLKAWSVPPYMKKSDTIQNKNPYFGGDFDSKWKNSYAQCLAEGVAYFEKKGLKVQTIAAQNEPGLKLPYPSTYLNDIDHADLLNAVQVQLNQRSSKAQIVVRADNFIASPGVKETLDHLNPNIQRPVYAAHCYSNDPDTPRQLLSNQETRFCSTPENKKLEYLMGECTASGEPNMQGDFTWWLQNRVLHDVDLGATGVLAWNGVLDQEYGPKNNGCPQCRGLITTDFSKRKNKNEVVVRLNPEYYALAHLSKFVKSGAERLLLNLNDTNGAPQAEQHLAFANQDGSTALLLNNFKSTTEPVLIQMNDQEVIKALLPPYSHWTIVIRQRGLQ